MTYIEYESSGQLNTLDLDETINQAVKASLSVLSCPYEAEVNVLVTDLDSIKELNRDYRQVDKPTDVLSFPLLTFVEPGDFTFLNEDKAELYFEPDSKNLLLGDIVICVDKVVEQAREYGHSFERELAFLTVHSMLHLMGFDHIEQNQRENMEDKQRLIMEHLGISR